MKNEIFINISTNKNFFIKAIVLFICALLLVSSFISAYFVFSNSIEEYRLNVEIDNRFSVLALSETDNIEQDIKAIMPDYDFSLIKEVSFFAYICGEYENLFSKKYHISRINSIKSEGDLPPVLRQNLSQILFAGSFPTKEGEILINANSIDESFFKFYGKTDIKELVGSTISISDFNGNEVDYIISGIIYSEKVSALAEANIYMIDYEHSIFDKIQNVEFYLYPDNFEDTDAVMECLSNNEKYSFCYLGQIGYYKKIQKIFQFGKEIFKTVFIPIALSFVFLLLMIIFIYFQKQSRLLNLMKLFGYNNFQLMRFQAFEISIIGVVSFLVTIPLNLGTFFVCKKLLKMLGIVSTIDIGIIIKSILFSFSLAVIIVVLTLLLTLTMRKEEKVEWKMFF